MKIFLRSPSTSHYFSIDCNEWDSISTLKDKIQQKENVGIANQYLLYHGKPLTDSESLSSYGIRNQNTLDLEIRIRGGMKTKIPEKTDEKKNITTKAPKKTHMDDFRPKARDLLPPGYKNLEDLKAIYRRHKKDAIEPSLIYWEYSLGEEQHYGSAVSEDFKYIFSGSGKSVIMYDLEAKQKVRCFEDIHTETIFTIAVSSGNKYLGTSSLDNTVRIYDIEIQKEEACFEDVTSYSICFSHDNKYFTLCTSDGSIKIFDIEQKTERGSILKAHAGMIICTVMTKNDKYIITGSMDGSAKIFDFDTLTEIHHFRNLHQDNVMSMRLSKDEKYLVTASYGASIKVMDFETRAEIYHFQKVHQDRIIDIAISDDNQYIVSSSWDYTIKVLCLKAKIEIYHFKGYFQNAVHTIMISPDNRYLVSGSYDRSVKMFYLEVNHPNESVYFDDFHNIVSMKLSGGGKFAVVLYSDDSLKVYDIESQEPPRHFKPTHEGKTCIVTLSADKKYLISGSSDQTIKIFDFESFSEIYHFRNINAGSVSDIKLTNDNKYLIGTFKDKSLRIFDFQSKSEVHCFKETDASEDLLFKVAEDNKYIVLGTGEGRRSLKILDLELMSEFFTFKDIHKDKISCLALTKDDKYVLSGSYDCTVKMIHIESKAEIFHFNNLGTYEIGSIAMTCDEKYLIAASLQTLKVLDLQMKQTLSGLYFWKISYNCELKLTERNQIIILNSTQSRETMSFPLLNNEDRILFTASFISPFTIFGTYDDTFLTNLDDPKIWAAYQDFYVLPHNWTPLHILAIFQPASFEQVPPYSEFKLALLIDRYGKTPLHYLLSHDAVDYQAIGVMFRYTIDYLEDKKRTTLEIQEVSDSMTNILLFLLVKMSTKLVSQYLRMCSIKTLTTYRSPLPQFGYLKKEYTFTTSMVAQPETLQNIVEEGNDQLTFTTVLPKFDYNLRSDDMLNIVPQLSLMKDEEIFKCTAVESMINYLWSQTYLHRVALIILFSVFMTLISVYVGLDSRNSALEIIILVFAVFFLIYEVIQVSQLREKYLSRIWNWTDSIFLVLVIEWISSRFASDDNFNLSQEWVSSIALIIGYFRWISYLRIFKPTRYLIQIITTALSEIIAFIIILIFLVVGFSLIFFEFNRDQDYSEHLYATYKLLFGDYEDRELSLSQKLFLSFMLFIFNVALISLVISIVKNAYEQTLGKKVVIDALTRLDMIEEIMVLMRVIQPRKIIERGYLIVCRAQRRGKDSSDSVWEGKDNVVTKLHKEADAKREQDTAQLRSDISKVREGMSQMKLNIKQEINDLATDISKVKQAVKQENKLVAETFQKDLGKLRADTKRQLNNMKQEIKEGFKGQEEVLRLLREVHARK